MDVLFIYICFFYTEIFAQVFIDFISTVSRQEIVAVEVDFLGRSMFWQNWWNIICSWFKLVTWKFQ